MSDEAENCDENGSEGNEVFKSKDKIVASQKEPDSEETDVDMMDTGTETGGSAITVSVTALGLSDMVSVGTGHSDGMYII